MASRSLIIARRVASACARAPVRAPAFVRGLATKGGEVVASKKKMDLASVLERELQYEKEDNNNESNIAELTASMDGWAVHDEAGNARFAVTKKFGAQTVRIDVDSTPMPGEEDEGDMEEGEDGGADAEGKEDSEGPLDGYRMVVTVTSDSKPSVLQFGCFVTDHLRVHRVTTYPASKAPTADQIFGGADELPLYGGPSFDELDQAVQNAFYEYLADRGMDDSMAEKLGDYAAAKEQAEYMRWLVATKELVSK